MRTLWGGAFDESPDQDLSWFGMSLETDITFWEEDVRGSIAHARMLGERGILSAQEATTIVNGLELILSEGPGALPLDVEDIHTAVETRLRDLIGDVAGKLHTARSRNDQVATDTRLWLMGQTDERRDQLKALQHALLDQAVAHADTLMPGVTHQQHAQPISLGFHLMAHFWAIQRHGWRNRQLRQVTAYSPLGSAALAGTPFPIDREHTSDALGFEAPIPNALDATSDRSYLLDALHACNLIGLDLGRLANEFVLWSTPEFGFLQLPDRLTTGSSIMPQKRNPDYAELVRGKSGAALGDYVQVSTMMKGLVLGYNRDTQDDKPPLFRAWETTENALIVMTACVQAAQFKPEAMRARLDHGFSTATDLADFLAARGMPFREAHELVGRVVRACLAEGIGLDDLDEASLERLAPGVSPEVLTVLKPEASRAWRESFGGTGPQALFQQFELAREVLERPDFPTPYHATSV